VAGHKEGDLYGRRMLQIQHDGHPCCPVARYRGYFKRLGEKSHLGLYSLEGKYEKMWNMETAVHVLVDLNKVLLFHVPPRPCTWLCRVT